MRKFYLLSVLQIFFYFVNGQTFPSFERFLNASYMKGASVSFRIKNLTNDSILFSFDADRELIPASSLKLVTTATALELLGEDFRYATSLFYDGKIADSILYGNLYVVGSGDPSLCSSEWGQDHAHLLHEWIESIKGRGIHTITGSVIADESIFDFDGVSMKWLREDLGSYYGQGSYGLNIFDNNFTLLLKTEAPDSKPLIIATKPDMPLLQFHNYLTTTPAEKDSFYIVGYPYANERYLYGVVPPNRNEFKMKGDIPEPSLFLAQHLTRLLAEEKVNVVGSPTNSRLLQKDNRWHKSERTLLTTTYSPPLKEIVRITNHVSHNLYADALLKTIGLAYPTKEVISSFDKGVLILKRFWESKGVDTSSLWMFDGCGLATTDKLTATFLCDLLSFMYAESAFSSAFIESIPRVGVEGTVSNFLKGSRLQEIARLKSGSMSRVRSYAGYIMKENKAYAVVVIVNNFSCSQAQMRMDIERLFLSLLP